MHQPHLSSAVTYTPASASPNCKFGFTTRTGLEQTCNPLYMERRAPTSEEDVFGHQGDASTSNAASNGNRPQVPSPSPLDPLLTRQTRPYPEYAQKSYGLGFTPPIRRGSPLNPQKASQRRSLQSAVSVLDSPPIRHRRIPSPGIAEMGSSTPEVDSEAGVFSNEYDLAHEDPRILLDVQRALKLKARREARLKREQSSSPHYSGSPLAPQSPSDSPNRARVTSLPSAPATPSPSPARKTSQSTASDLDFSPATGVQTIAAFPHPVPSSPDNGKTLDWTGSYADEERLEKRWPIIGKKKDEDKILPLQALAEQQENIYREKLEKIKALCTSQTQRKASITREQLGRRYKLLSEHGSDKPAFHFLGAAKWYSGTDKAFKQTTEKAEPFTWLKHLERGAQRSADRSEWHLSALVMEKYVQACSNPSTMPVIPEDTTPEDIRNLRPSPASPDAISFEPRRNSTESSEPRRTKSSTDSTGSLPISAAPLTRTPLKSTTSPRQSLQYGKGEGSVVESASDMSENDAVKASPFIPPAPRKPENTSPQIQFIVTQDPDERGEPGSVIPVQIKLSHSGSTKASDELSSPSDKPIPPALRTNSQTRLPRRIRVSHTPMDIRRRLPEDNEIRLSREYETKARLVDEVNVHNHRIRQTLNRLAAAVREYDAIQNAALKTPGIPHLPLPRELVEAFSHDPAAVTGATRRLTGWRAVEDIHQRVLRQREIFQAFLSQRPTPPSDSIHILDSPISRLTDSLNELEKEKDEIVATATNLTDLLQRVQKVHREVKTEYNSTVAITSVVYPELSHIIALEESYRDQYQQLWDFGMDALTLLLDTVTPFWRNYGKTIGEDVRDFLIIPLYRNEFTGEPKRYPLNEIPRRSLRHWLGFILFFIVSIGIAFLQLRAAIASSISYRLQWIPYDGVRWTALPFFWMGIVIQWVAVLFEFAIVLMQLGVVTWWAGWLINVFQ